MQRKSKTSATPKPGHGRLGRTGPPRVARTRLVEDVDELFGRLELPPRPEREGPAAVGSGRTAAKLTIEQQEFVVACLAYFWDFSDIQAEMRDRWGLEISKSAIGYYRALVRDPRSESTERLAILYAALRSKYLREVEEHASAHQAYRQEAYTRVVRAATARGNHPLALQALEQAAKDAGGVYTKSRELTGANGAPLIPPGAVVVNVADLLAGVRAGSTEIPGLDEGESDETQG